MSSRARQDAVADLVETAKHTLAGNSLSKAALMPILVSLEGLAARRDLWSETHFPTPQAEEQQIRYLIREEPDRTFALYLNVMRPGRRIPPHNHTTWALVAAVEGCEHNYLYERLDDGTVPGHAQIREIRVVRVEPGSSIALLPDDIHAVEIGGDQVIRHLHFYGRALEVLYGRLTFDLDAQTCKQMVLTVPTRR